MASAFLSRLRSLTPPALGWLRLLATPTSYLLVLAAFLNLAQVIVAQELLSTTQMLPWSLVLFGAAAALREAIGMPPWLPERTLYDAAEARLRATLSASAFEAAWSTGRALPLQDALERAGSFTRVLSAIQVTEVAEPYIRRRAIRHLEKGRIVIFAAGTGNPFFTTAAAAALRALEIHADAILMAKHGVEGVYDSDPTENPDATFLPALTHMEAIERSLGVMDSTALSLCMDNGLPIHVFNLADERNIDRVIRGERIGTIVGA